MRKCIINDCCGDILAPCCRECPNTDCPDRCPKADNDEYCANEREDEIDS